MQTEQQTRAARMRIDTLLVWASGGAIVVLLAAWPWSASRAASVPALRANERPATKQIDYRRCWVRDGKRHCRWVEGRRQRKDRNSARPEDNMLPPNLGFGF